MVQVKVGPHLKENPRIHEGDADTLALASEMDGIALLHDEKLIGQKKSLGNLK